MKSFVLIILKILYIFLTSRQQKSLSKAGENKKELEVIDAQNKTISDLNAIAPSSLPDDEAFKPRAKTKT